jgi:Na+/proline symporter
MPSLNFLNGLDYFVVGLYMLTVVGIGIYVSRFNRETADYFKGGGHLPWGLACVSLFISGFSAFMFVGAAGVTYGSGGGALLLFSLAGPAYMFGYFLYGPLWRRTRIDTPMQFLSRRYSPGTTYFYTLLAVLPNVLILGIWIYMLCILISTALGFNALTFDLGIATVNGFQLSILVTGVVMTIYTMVGGLWAVIVSDAVQFLILVLLTLIMLPVAYHVLGDGSIVDGITRLARDAPEGYFDITLHGQPKLFWVAYFVNIVLGYNVQWHIAQRYYSVPDERDTRKMALWCAGLGVLLPLMWITPVLVTPILFPNIEAMWPALAKPAEAAFVTLALTVLPHGMLGIMVAAIFAATMSSADTTFNWLAAVLTKDVYVPASEHLAGAAPSERRQLFFGKASVMVMGLFAVWVAFNMERFGGAFDVYIRADSLYKAPMFIPVMLGLVFTRTPWWSAIVAFGAGVLGIIATGFLANILQGQPVDSLADIFTDIRLTVFGLEMGRYEVNTVVGIVVSTAAFFGSALFNRREGAFKDRIEHLEHDLRTPAYAPPGTKLDLRGFRAYNLAGRIAMGIGGLLLVVAIPTFGEGGVLNLIAGVLALGLGWLIVVATRRYERRYRARNAEAARVGA